MASHRQAKLSAASHRRHRYSRSREVKPQTLLGITGFVAMHLIGRLIGTYGS
jgi:hypothetical protein